MSALSAVAPPWVDPKRRLWLLGPALPLLACACLVLYAWQGATWLCWVMPALLFVIVPLLDWRVGSDSSNPPAAATEALHADRYYELLIVVGIPLQWLVTALGAWCASRGAPTAWAWFGLLLSVGAVNGFGINSAHELGHKHRTLGRWLARLALAPAAYGHFFVEHNRGHHRHVATPGDPASARMGESYWRFLPRTVFGSLASAWRLEAQRLAGLGRGRWSWRNQNLQAWSLTLLMFGALTAWLGASALLFLLLQAAYAASLLEVVNYLEHYGLLRQREASGEFERCTPAHSWNSNNVVTNLLLFQLQRHSDHHAHPARSYQALRHFESSPQLPSGYASMLLLAYVPRLWFAVMDPRVAAHYNGDIARANLQPSARQALLARYAN